MATTDMLRIQGSQAGSFSKEEPLVSAVGATVPKGDATLDPKVMSKASNFPLAPKITLALTSQRIRVFKSGWGNKVGSLIGDVDLQRVQEIEIVWNRKLAVLAFGLTDAPPVAMRPNDTNAAEHFRLAFLKLRGKL